MDAQLGVDDALLAGTLPTGTRWCFHVVLDYGDRFEEAITYLGTLLAEGKLHYDETIVEGGIDVAVDTLAELFDGRNMGKLLVRVSD